MPAIQRSEFALALNQVCSERGIEPEVVLETIKIAILAAYKKDYGDQAWETLVVEINPDTGEAKIFKDKKDITPAGFGRIAAQTAKQVILQRIREAEKTAVISDYANKIGTITNGLVLRFDGPNVIVDIGKTEAVMPSQEQVPSEHYRLNQRLVVYLESIREGYRGQEVVVSRAHKGLVENLFKREVPEVSSKAVEVKAIAREPGSRTKIAVFSSQSGVDPVGSCVGQKGVRVQAVINELNGEKIDIIQWSSEIEKFLASSLSPAKEVKIEIVSSKKQIALAQVPPEQLSLAIGRDGQNVRLAARLTGWKIDIQGQKDQTEEEGKVEKVAKVEEVEVSKEATSATVSASKVKALRQSSGQAVKTKKAVKVKTKAAKNAPGKTKKSK